MEKTDEELLFGFMHEQKKEVEDNGFSRKVMRSLPSAHKWGYRLFNLICTAVCLFLFYMLNGVELMYNTLKEALLTSIQNLSENVTLPALGVAIGVMFVLGIAYVVQEE